MAETHDLSTTFLHLGATGVATPLPIGPDFWANIPPILSSGRMSLRLETPDGEIVVDLPAGRYIVVPRNIWHTADVPEPRSAIYITEGQGAENRARAT